MMDSPTKSDLFSKLPQSLLVLIISFLPFKDCVRTSVLSKRWKNLCYKTKNLVFKESEFVNLPTIETDITEATKIQRGVFVRIICQWISKYSGDVLESFELYLSQTKGFEEDIMFLIEFATSRDVTNLVLDFSDHVHRTISPIQQALAIQNNDFDISRIFFNFLYVETVTICHFFLEMIQDYDDPMELHDAMEIRHLVMKTNMHIENFIGIGIFLNSCPKLESLTFDMVHTRRNVRFFPRIVSETYWATRKSHECLKKSLKVVKVKNFRGSSNELHVLEYLLRTGLVMERLDLYEARELDSNQKRLVLAGVDKVQRNFKRASMHLRIIIHNA